MKFLQIATLLSTMASSATAFSVPSVAPRLSRASPVVLSAPSTTALKMSDFESDFASAMPEAPKKTLREYLLDSADRCISNVRGSLADGVDAIPELETLEKLRDDESASEEALALGVYEVMIERGMTYDEDPDNGLLTPTEFDIQANLEVPEVMDEFRYLYGYGMKLIQQGLASVDGVKDVVMKRLISRTGKTPEEFDEWLGF